MGPAGAARVSRGARADRAQTAGTVGKRHTRPHTKGGTVNLALGILFIWLGGAALWLGTHGIEASSPWEAFQTVLGAARGD